MTRILSNQINKLTGKKITMSGWVYSRRDHGKLIFIDLKDLEGITQLVFLPNNHKAYTKAKSLKPNSVIKVSGIVNKRPARLINKDIISGKVELEVRDIEILNQSATPPFEIDKDTILVEEDLRLKYRYLDLKTKRMNLNIINRYNIVHFARNYLHDKGFIEIQTPILSKSTPEGARDYLVPSRLHPGKFFALPQSPQQYKQLIMISGFEKYFQVAPCFRDEDARADRSPGEFYQLDIEMAFVSQEEILNLVEEMFTQLIKKIFPQKKITQTPWPRLKHKDVIKKYNSDKPDLRKNKNDKNELAFAWIVDFPLFNKQSKDDFFHGAGGQLAPSHHMFTAPKEEDIKLLDKSPLKVRSYQHDLVLNGLEVGGGSIRIHNWDLQNKIFDLIGFSKKQKEQFNHLKTAFSYGVPPHGGIAPGLDRLISILCNESNIKEVIAFPLTGEARDPLMDSPTHVTKKQLDEVHIKTVEKK
jgi:aspartyl-tRNA synthetase